jgi:hypothetical protein
MVRKVLFVLPILVFALWPASALADVADPGQVTKSVGPKTSGPVTTQGSAGFDATGTGAAAGSHTDVPAPAPVAGVLGATGTSDVIYRPIPYNALPGGGPPWVDQFGVIHLAPAIPVSACPAGQMGFYAYDGTGAILGVVCVGPGANPAPGAPAPSPLELAQQASAAQPWPVLQFGLNPTTGLTGLSSWVWLGGNPQMPDATASAGPLTVVVHARLVDVVWNFGDGGGLSSGTNVGRPFPAPGGIQHVYQTDTFGRPGGYGLSALLRYEVTFSVNGGPFNFLGVKARPFVTSYQVNQLQPQAVSGR